MNGKDRQRIIREMRGYMWSPGRPTTARREDRVQFWEGIASGMSTEDAAAVAGVSSAVGARWFRQGGGMPSISLKSVTNRSLLVVRRARRDRYSAGPRDRCSRDRSADGSITVDHLERASPQRVDPSLWGPISGVDRSVAR
jgi:hypothetical protein